MPGMRVCLPSKMFLMCFPSSSSNFRSGLCFQCCFCPWCRKWPNGNALVDLLYTMTTHVPWVCQSSRKEKEEANEVCFRDAHSHRMCSIVMRYLHFTVYSRSSRNICIPCPKYIVPERLICPGRIVRSSSNKFTNMFDQKGKVRKKVIRGKKLIRKKCN